MSVTYAGNVVHMHRYLNQTSSVNPVVAERLLYEVQGLGLDLMGKTLSSIMDKVDDAIFAIANKATNSAEQDRYFDTMREVRLRRENIEASFRANLYGACLSAFKQVTRKEQQEISAAFTEIGQGLTRNDDLESLLAVTTLADKLSSSCNHEISTLNQRLAHLLGIGGTGTELNPFSPRIICDAFKASCNELECGIRIKLIIFKLFDNYISRELPNIYRRLNNHLVNHGIMENIEPAPIEDRQNDKEEDKVNKEISSNVVEELEVFNALQSLMQVMPVAGKNAAQTDNSSVQKISPVQDRFIKSLTSMQKQILQSQEVDNRQFEASAMATGSGNMIRSIKATELASGLDQIDIITMDIVAMLFDRILENCTIPNGIKALLGELQIPVLKAAILNKTFFYSKDHPARHLVNIIAHVSVRCSVSEQYNNSLHDKIKAAVRTVVAEFESDIDIFRKVLLDLNKHLEEEQTNIDKVIDAQTLLARQREELNTAENMARDEILRRIGRNPLPSTVLNFLHDVWRNLLVLTYMQNGAHGIEWKNYLLTASELIWSIGPKESVDQQSRLTNRLPILLRKLNEGMHSVSLPDKERKEFLDWLANHHAKLLNRQSVCSKPIAPAKSGDNQNVTQISVSAQAELPLPCSVQEQSAITQGEKKIFIPEISDDCASKATTDSSARTAELPAVTEARSGIAAEGVPVQEYASMVSKLGPGIWIEFVQEDGTTSRQRLSWVSSGMGVYIFTNRQGLKTFDKTAAELEDDLRKGRATIVEDSEFLLDKAFGMLLEDLDKAAGTDSK